MASTRSVRLGVLTVAMAAGAAFSVPQAHAGFNLDAFDTYGLLVNDGASGGDNNTAPVNANIGIGGVTGHIDLHNEVVNGKVDVDGNAATSVANGAITGTQPVSLGGAPSPAHVASDVAAVENAITAAKGLSLTYGAESGSGTHVTINGTTTINAASGLLDGSGTYVFAASSFSIGNGHTVTINGTSSEYVVIDVTGNGGNKLDGALTLAGGITPDQVLINFIGTGGEVKGAANGATLQGTFLIPNQKVNLDNLTIDGHLFGGQAGQNFQFVSNALISQPALDPPPAATPEPNSMTLLVAGLAGFGVIRLRRRPAKAGTARLCRLSLQLVK